MARTGRGFRPWSRRFGAIAEQGPVTETPTPGGAVASGDAPLAVVANTAQGAVTGGNSPTPSTTLTAQGATGQGTSPSPRTTVTIQGATGQGTSPAPTTSVTPGGATGQGNNANATATAVFTIQGATGAGTSPGPSTSPAAGGGTGFGTSPNPSAAVPQGGAPAPGTGPSAVVSVLTPDDFDTEILDDFNRADEDPASGWTAFTGVSPAQEVVGNEATSGAGFFEDYGEVADVFVVATLASDMSSGESVEVGARIDTVTTGEDFGFGYFVLYSESEGPQVGIRRRDGGNVSNLGGPPQAPDLAPGDKIGIRCYGTRIEAWAHYNGSWHFLDAITDATYASGGIGIIVGAESLDDFAVLQPVPTAVAGGNAPTEDMGVTETPVFGGATAAGNAPSVSTSLTGQGAIGGGAGPAASTVANQGGSSADDFDVSAVVGVTPGGATGQGNEPDVSQTELVTLQGAIAGGAGPAASSVANQGGSSAADFDVSAVVGVTPGGATAGGNAPQAPLAETPVPGGAIAGGFGAASSAVANQGGSSADDFDVDAVVGVTPGGATSGGNEPQAPLTETPLFGGAIAGGAGASASTVANQGGSTVSDFQVSPTITITAGGANSGGNQPTAPLQDLVSPGGAIAGGFPPTEIIVPGGPTPGSGVAQRDPFDVFLRDRLREQLEEELKEEEEEEEVAIMTALMLLK